MSQQQLLPDCPPAVAAAAGRLRVDHSGEAPAAAVADELSAVARAAELRSKCPTVLHTYCMHT